MLNNMGIIIVHHHEIPLLNKSRQVTVNSSQRWPSPLNHQDVDREHLNNAHDEYLLSETEDEVGAPACNRLNSRGVAPLQNPKNK